MRWNEDEGRETMAALHPATTGAAGVEPGTPSLHAGWFSPAISMRRTFATRRMTFRSVSRVVHTRS